MLPNKIYAGFDENTHLESYCTEKKGKCQTEYIRKDALLEWAKEQKKDCERVIREHPEDESLWCERDKYDELIDKLNSM